MSHILNVHLLFGVPMWWPLIGLISLVIMAYLNGGIDRTWASGVADISYTSNETMFGYLRDPRDNFARELEINQWFEETRNVKIPMGVLIIEHLIYIVAYALIGPLGLLAILVVDLPVKS